MDITSLITFLMFFISWTGVSEPRISVTGKELPTARYVSAINHRDFGFHDHAVTVYLPAWGQLIDHDMTQGAESKGNCYTPSYTTNVIFICPTMGRELRRGKVILLFVEFGHQSHKK